jgi:hypothetical protein
LEIEEANPEYLRNDTLFTEIRGYGVIAVTINQPGTGIREFLNHTIKTKKIRERKIRNVIITTVSDGIPLWEKGSNPPLIPITIFDISGRIIYKIEHPKRLKSNILHIPDISSGLYFVKHKRTIPVIIIR